MEFFQNFLNYSRLVWACVVPAHHSLKMACRKTARRAGTKKRAQRATSNVFAMFDQDQIQEFKEAFNMIDQNRDGFIDHDDLKDMLASLGKVRTFLIFALPQS